MSHFLLASSYFFHLSATVIWVGGMSLLVLVIYPLQRRTEAEATQALLSAIEARFRPIANFCLLVLLITGVVQTGGDEHYGTWFDFRNDWSKAILGKHLAFIPMVLIVIFLQFGLAPTLERARLIAKKTGDITPVRQLREREHRLAQVNFGLSLIVLFFTAIATAL